MHRGMLGDLRRRRPVPYRVSSIRAGDNAVNAPGTGGADSGADNAACDGAVPPAAGDAATGPTAASSTPTTTVATDLKVRTRATVTPLPPD